MEKVRAKCPYPTLVVKTSIGHYHIYWKLDEKVSVEEQENIMKLLAKNIGADPAATDVSRVLRLPGFWHKGKDNTVDIVFSRFGKVQYKSFLSALPSQVISTATGCTPTRHRAGGVQKGTQIYNSGVGEGKERFVFKSKSHEDWYLVNEWLRRGVSQGECVKRLKVRRAGEKKDIDYYSHYTVKKAIECWEK